ncbi:MAG: hypothetical protein QOG43_2904, partial [Actinomycetota bacterium]|nr:hypothetical protein [Actinomycetota bacterium]
MSWLRPRRVTEATSDQLALSGAVGGLGYDPVDGDYGFQSAGGGGREVPRWTLEKARAFSVAGYRVNPMARAIIDTYTAFCVGDSGLTVQSPDPATRDVAQGFWDDPANNLSRSQDLWLRDHLLNGEQAIEAMVGPISGVVRLSVVDTARVLGVDLLDGNPLRPSGLHIRQGLADETTRTVITPDDITGRRTGQLHWWPSFRATLTDRRGYPFLGPVLDWLDSYDTVLANLVDRTALMRYIAYQVKIAGTAADVAKYVADHGGKGNNVPMPRSGTVEVTNDKVEMLPMSADVKAEEDKTTSGALLTNVAAGTGLAKTWLAEPEHANRATSISMAEPVRRRVGGVQNLWLAYVTELLRHSVDQAVEAGRIPAEVTIAAGTPHERTMPAAATVTITGPQIAAENAAVNAEVLKNLSQALIPLRQAN